MTLPAVLSAVYVMLLERHDRDLVDDAVFTSPDEQQRREQEERRRVILEAGGVIADVVPLKGVS